VDAVITVAVAFIAGALLGALLAQAMPRRRRDPPMAVRRDGVTPRLLPDPALGWLRRARGALGVWAVETGPAGAGSTTYQSLDPDRAPDPATLDIIEGRLAASARRDGPSVERLDAGLLMLQGAGGSVAAVLLDAGCSSGLQEAARGDLAALLDGIGRRPVLHDLAQVEEGVSIETVGSVGMRLAFQIERIAGGEVYVAAREPAGVRIIGVSGLGDRRALNQVLLPDSPLARVAAGAAEEMTSPDPLGGAVSDRRRHPPARVAPIIRFDQAIGGVAWRVPDGTPMGQAAVREVGEALQAAGPRLEVALKLAEGHEGATRDPLTGLLNRRGFDERLRLLGVERGTLIALDYDRFKTVNDTLGHPAGDAALIHLGRILHEQVRGVDAVARVGGEEFLLWLPGAALEEGLRVAERIRARLASTPWDWQGRPWPLSASFGVAAWPETTNSRDNLPSQADAALYAAKEGGRNRVVTWSAVLKNVSGETHG
jgi:diguanylate cyclase (GGDEF)-like protein